MSSRYDNETKNLLTEHTLYNLPIYLFYKTQISFFGGDFDIYYKLWLESEYRENYLEKLQTASKSLESMDSEDLNIETVIRIMVGAWADFNKSLIKKIAKDICKKYKLKINSRTVINQCLLEFLHLVDNHRVEYIGGSKIMKGGMNVLSFLFLLLLGTITTTYGFIKLPDRRRMSSTSTSTITNNRGKDSVIKRNPVLEEIGKLENNLEGLVADVDEVLRKKNIYADVNVGVFFQNPGFLNLPRFWQGIDSNIKLPISESQKLYIDFASQGITSQSYIASFPHQLEKLGNPTPENLFHVISYFLFTVESMEKLLKLGSKLGLPVPSNTNILSKNSHFVHFMQFLKIIKYFEYAVKEGKDVVEFGESLNYDVHKTGEFLQQMINFMSTHSHIHYHFVELLESLGVTQVLHGGKKTKRVKNTRQTRKKIKLYKYI